MGWAKGQSGNPAGRPPGIPTVAREYRKLLEPHAPALVAKAVEMAMAGDVSALRLCLDKIMPNLKHIEMEADVRHSLDDLTLEQLLRRHADLTRQLEDLQAHPQGHPSTGPDEGLAKANPIPPH